VISRDVQLDASSLDDWPFVRQRCRSLAATVLGFTAALAGSRAGDVDPVLPVNPVREAARVRGNSRRAPRALTEEEREQWPAALEADVRAVKKNLPDLTRWMLATGLRIGEALAVSWSGISTWRLARRSRLDADPDQGRGLAPRATVEGRR
jgi:integrase